MKRKMIVILVCFSLIFGTLIDASKVQAASIEISGIYVRMENISVGDLSTGNYIAKVISRKRLSVNKRYMGEIYRRIPTIYYSLSNTTGYGISIGVYVKRESGYHLVDYNLIDDGMWRSGKFNELNLKPKELEKGKSLDLKVVAVDIQGVANKKIKYITYTIPTKLNRAYVDTYKKGNVVYFMYRCEGTNCETQYRYKKTEKWKKIPKLCGKLEPIKKVKFKTKKAFYVRCRTSEKIGGKVVYSP